MTTETQTTALSVPEAIATRRSIRKYTDQAVPQQDLDTILKLAGLAPSAWNIQPWRFAVVTNPEVKAKLKAAAYGQGQIESAPVVLVVYSDMQHALANLEDVLHPGLPVEQRAGSIAGILNAFAGQTTEEQEAWGAGQTYIAVGYLSLAARSLGYDTSLMLGFNPEQVKEILDLPAHVRIPALIPLGVAAEEGFPHFRYETSKIAQFVN
jgi:nitroreductase